MNTSPAGKKTSIFHGKRAFTKTFFFAIFLYVTLVCIFCYLITRTFLFFIADYLWYEKTLALFLLLAETFILVHSFGYFTNILHVLSYKKENILSAPQRFELKEYPPVAIIVSSYKEPLDVIDDTLTCFYNLTYPNKYLYFLDDTRYGLPGEDTEKMLSYKRDINNLCKTLGVNLFRRSWRGAKAGMINDFLTFIEGTPKEGFECHVFDKKSIQVSQSTEDGAKAGMINTFLGFLEGKEKDNIEYHYYDKRISHKKPEYIVLFDADQNPFPDFVEPLVATMEQNPALAFIQTPQYYTNFETNRVARASGLQQAVFYEYICEGKSIEDAMFCCGTNVIFRREALMDVGGFDESSITEDFATSLKFHMKQWHSAYLNKVCAFGMGPEDLGGYFKQQFRWALGTVGIFRTILVRFFKNPHRLPFVKWWEYFLSGTHYFVGWVFFIMAICPALYLFLSVPTYFARPDVFILFFTPYIILSVVMFFTTLIRRNYRFQDLFFGLLLGAICFPVYMKASASAILGIKSSFGITPKGQSVSLPLFSLWAQILLALLSFSAVVWGINRIIYETEHLYAISVNTFWCFYHFCILSTVIYFNRPVED